MAEQELSEVTAANLQERMETRLAILHYNDQYNGRHAGEYDFLREMLTDDILDDDGSSFSAKDGTEQSHKKRDIIVRFDGER